MRHEYCEYEYRGTQYQDSYYFPTDTKTPAPVVFVIPDYHGFTTYAEDAAKQMCALGYVGCCVDFYGQRAMPKTSEQAAEMIMPFFNDRSKGVVRAQAALDHAKVKKEVDSSQMAAIGYSSGGMVVLDMARSSKPPLTC